MLSLRWRSRRRRRNRVVGRGLGLERLEPRELLAWDVGFADPIGYLVGENPEGVTIADVDGDQRLDLLTGNFADDSISVLSGNGDGTFDLAVDYSVGDGPISVAVTDFTRDGRPDVAVANLLSDDASLLLGLPDETLGFGLRFDAGESPESVVVADVNGDRQPDLIVASSGSPAATGGVSVLLGNRSGTLAESASVMEAIGSVHVVSADFNQDRRPDLAVANSQLFGFGDNNIAVLIGNGDGTFASPKVYQTADDPWWLGTADIDGDGDEDLAVANKGSNTVSVLRNHGDGTFASAVHYPVGDSPNSLVLVDLNDDTYPDIATANGDSHDVSVLVNRGGGSFSARGRFEAGTSPRGLASGDFDGDLLPDLAVVTQESDEVLVLINRPSETARPVTLNGNGDVYHQDFDHAMARDGLSAGTLLPLGWSASLEGRDEVSITQDFPGDRVQRGTYDAGQPNSPDRALAIGIADGSEPNELRFDATISDDDAVAVRVSFDVEAWGADPQSADDPGEASFRVTLEFDDRGTNTTRVDFGEVTTGPTLRPPAPAVGRELWKTDGTGVSLVGDFTRGADDSDPWILTEYNGDLYFVTKTGQWTGELQRYDGRDVNSLVEMVWNRTTGADHVIFDNRLYFIAKDLEGAVGHEVWSTDGTGVKLVEDLEPGRFGSAPWSLAVFNGELYTAADVDGLGRELWKINDTGAHLVADIDPLDLDESREERRGTFPGSRPSDFIEFNGHLYFTASDKAVADPSGQRRDVTRELWKTDGESVSLAADINPGDFGASPRWLTVFKDALYFVADDGTHGFELWRTDGRKTEIVLDVNPGPEGGFFLPPSGSTLRSGGSLTVLGDELFFMADDGETGWELWKTDGERTTRVTDINVGPGDSVAPWFHAFTPVDGVAEMAVYNGELYFAANNGRSGYGLWKTDGATVTEVGNPTPHSDFIPPWGFDQTNGPDSLSALTHFNVAGGYLFFLADDGTTGVELWKTDGTGIVRVTDLNPGQADSFSTVGSINGFFTYGNELYFSASNGSRNSSVLHGNSPTNRVHFDSGVFDVRIPAQTQLRLRFNTQGTGAANGYIYGVDNFRFDVLAAGDSDGNGWFDQLDIVTVLQAGTYLTGQPATFAAGDWSGDGVFDQQDIVTALQRGHYLQETDTEAETPNPSD